MKRIIVVALSLLVSAQSFAAARVNKLECPVVGEIAQHFTRYHIDAKKLDLEHEGRTIERFIKQLDPNKLYLRKSDVAEIRGMLRGIFKNFGKDCGSIEKAYAVYVKRFNEMSEFLKKTLGPDYKFDENTEIVSNPDNRDYAADEKEAEAQMKKFIHFYISNYIASDTKLPEAKKLLIHRYDVNTKRLTETKTEEVYALFLDAYATALDAHSSYLSKDSFEDFEIGMNLSLEGIGAQLTSDDGYTKVEGLIPGGAADRSGEMEVGDKIIAVAQGPGAFEQVIDMPLRDVVKLIRGKKGTQVRLTILRQSPKETLHKVVTLTRDKVKLEDEAAKLYYTKRKVGDRTYKVAVIDLPSFYGDMQKHSRSCYEDMKKKVEQAVREKADGIVLDLSKNGGGLLTEAVRIGGLFIKKGNIVQTMDSRDRSDMLPDEDEKTYFNGPLIILTSRLSASASEIVAGAMQDYKRALIVGGDHTFGKGTVQALLPLPEELGAIKVTTGMFFVPGGNSTQYRGVPGDIVLPSPFSTKEIGEETLDYSLKPRSLPPFLSADADGTEPSEHWDPVTPELVKKLRDRSSARVDKDAEFKKIREELVEQEKKKGVIKLADSLKKQKEEKADPKNKNKQGRRNKHQTEEEFMKQPQVIEAANIMGDWLELSGRAPQQSLAKGEKAASPSAASEE
jgi:carboxyl-terminal processing protease